MTELAKGAQLLGELLPLTSRSALGHVHLVACFPSAGHWSGASSSSHFQLNGTIFLSRDGLSSPWWVAEHLLHEALHQQMYDFRHGHTLLDEKKLGRADGPRVHAIWNPPDANGGNLWSTLRSLAAFHVYVHIAILYRLADQGAMELGRRYGAVDGPTAICRSRTASERAHYLDEQIRAVCWEELGAAGKRFVDWFSSVLQVLDDSE